MTNISSEPQHNIFLIIPAFITNDPEIDDSTAILFGRIMALSNQYGYCWAGDKYLAELTRVSEREVKNRLKTLEDRGYIKRKTFKNGFTWQRHIFPQTQNNPTKGTGVPLDKEQACPSEGNGCSQEYDKETIIKDLKDNDNVRDRDRSFENLESIVSFDPETYLLPNGKSLTLRCQRAFKKYYGPDRAKLLANIEYFEEQMKKSGCSIADQEKYLQKCINQNYAGKEVNRWQNRMYAEVMKEESKLYKFQILKTCIQFYKEGKLNDSVSFDLPVNTFSDIIDANVKKG